MADNGHTPTPVLTKDQQDLLDRLIAEHPSITELAAGARKLYGPAAVPEEPPADPWKAFTLADAYRERPPVERIAGRLFEIPSLNIVFGAPGSLKSFVMQDLAVCVAAGQNWLTPAPWQNTGNTGPGIATRQAPVVWLDFDNGTSRTHNRFEALGRARKLSPDTPITYYSMPNPWLYATRPESIGSLADRIKERAAKLVIIDNLGNVSAEADENSGDMGKVMSHFRQLAEDTSAAIVLIHHQRKSNGSTGRTGDTLRGHSSIEAALDLALLVERESPHSDSITVKATKVRGAEVLPFGAVFTCMSKLESDELQEARFFGLEGTDNESDTAIKREILAALKTSGKQNQSQLVKAVQASLEEGGGKAGLNRIRGLIDRMVADNRVQIKPSLKPNERLYDLPE